MRSGNNTKTVLLLGGSPQQLDSFKAAKEMGWKTVCCDWDVTCPGKELADVFYEVSTLDLEAVLEVAHKENVEGVVSYASDAPAPVAAWVSEQLGLPSNPYESVAMLCDKGKFRNFLLEHGFSVPKCAVANAEDAPCAREIAREIGFPLVIKPVDSAGSRGVTITKAEQDVDSAFSHALEFSRKQQVVFEKFIETHTPGRVVEAEIFVENGEVILWGLMSTMRDMSLNGIVPSLYIHPIMETKENEDNVRATIDKLIKTSGIKQGPLNIELIIDDAGDVYIIDVGPRNGGHYLPNFFSHISGENLTEATLRVSTGESAQLHQFDSSSSGVWIEFMHYAHRPGIFKGLEPSSEFEEAVIETHLYKTVGDLVEPMTSVSNTIGLSFLNFPNENDSLSLIDHLPNLCKTTVV